jgi:hypothetical protein
VIAFLRFIGLVNAAVWFGAALFFTVAVGPAFFSEPMLKVFGWPKAPYAKTYTGLAAMVVMERYFLWHYICGGLAVLHGLAEAAYQGRPFRQLRNLLAVLIFGLALAGGLWLQPKLRQLHETQYSPGVPQAQQKQAAAAFGAWHGVSQAVNLLMTAGLLVFFWKTANPPAREPYVNPFQFKS